MSTLEQQITDLIESSRAVVDAVGTLGDRVDSHQTQISGNVQRLRRTLAVTICGLLLDMSLTVFGTYLFVEQRVISDNLQSIQARTSTEILCPLYEVFAESIKAMPTLPGLTPDEVQIRKDAANTISTGLTTLGCV